MTRNMKLSYAWAIRILTLALVGSACTAAPLLAQRQSIRIVPHPRSWCTMFESQPSSFST